MTKDPKKLIWIILGIILLLAMSGEFANMARQLSFLDALGSLAVLTLIVLGIRYWIKKSKG